MYSSQRALSFLPELKWNKFAWDILNQLRRFSMFWKNASTGDICSLNTTFECCFIWRNKQRARFSSLARSMEVISDIVLEFYCVQSLTSVFVSCFVFYWSTLVSLVSRLWRNRNKYWTGFATQRRMSPKLFSGDVTWGWRYLRQIYSVLVRVKRRVLSGMSTFRVRAWKMTELPLYGDHGVNEAEFAII